MSRISPGVPSWEAGHGRKLTGRPRASTRPGRAGQPEAERHRPCHAVDRAPGPRGGAGFNAQVVASPDQIILAGEVTRSADDNDQVDAMVDRAISELASARIDEPIETTWPTAGTGTRPRSPRPDGQGASTSGKNRKKKRPNCDR
jgi:hypothetical protein